MNDSENNAVSSESSLPLQFFCASVSVFSAYDSEAIHRNQQAKANNSCQSRPLSGVIGYKL